eukprot:m.439004 g.439004  ORF g.439004 m.439004 type:complete len:72 (+) comp18318_c0_seq1:135-350(+)
MGCSGSKAVPVVAANSEKAGQPMKMVVEDTDAPLQKAAEDVSTSVVTSALLLAKDEIKLINDAPHHVIAVL